VTNFGGGLVVLSGPRFGPGQLADTPLADMLPVKLDPAGGLRDRKPFRLQLTPEAVQYDFMRLGSDSVDGKGAESDKAWGNLGPLPWYQPVERLAQLSTALAVHPVDKCVDGKTPQPLVAVRQYGRGEVVYLAFNETWRLRRKYGDRYYRQFWGQMIHRLALRHALGAQKRFVVRTDRRRYQVDDHVLVTVEAYDADFKPLAEDKLPEHKLLATLTIPGRDPSKANVRRLNISQLRDGVFEARIPLVVGGEHRLAVIDPISKEPVEVTFQVTALSVERRRAVRGAALEQALAAATGGKTFDLTTAGKLPVEIKLVSKTETHIEVISLWNTWFCFICVIVLMLGEWLGRKRVNLP